MTAWPRPVEQEYAHALADRLEERAERHARWARMLNRAAPLDLPDDFAFQRRCRQYRRHNDQADRLRDAAQVVREEADR